MENSKQILTLTLARLRREIGEIEKTIKLLQTWNAQRGGEEKQLADAKRKLENRKIAESSLMKMIDEVSDESVS